MTSFGITNGPVPARLTVGIVSAGRVGTAVGAALERAGHIVGACSAVSAASVARAAKRLPDSEILPAADVAARSELLILAVPDDQLADLVKGLAATNAVKPGTLVAHTSGANGISILAPLTELGALPLAIHPAMTFTGHDEDTARLSSACFGITAADDIGYAIAQSLVLEIGGEPVRVREENRALYHAALAHGSNHLVTLVVDAVEALRASLQGDELLGQQLIDGDPGGVAERVLQPLLSAALDNALRRGPSALTGPVARGDAAAVETHLRVLTDLDPELAAGYRAMSLRSAQRVGAPTTLFDILTETGGDRRE
ncbi:DUF2520 domain-containing protein [Rhodococcus sp. AD45-ID]|uniref:Putative short-subunit dehydrogenase-like oxidoreductase (DUF2520 family) n=1 Tax=Nocardia globerula TaxID=1818 RepID=A0A652YVS6_NOCGL|nr:MULTISPECIES: DUF2520 domain-containing protein [Rhodococcus]NMD60499.1 DUF2520 domain-containing protein [Nocardia globerula]NRI65712.1 DUF2520 domain-containing protein [Rhodococcus sp. MS16]KJF20604.1 hypothetical protein SZ00_03801 [Rhodococcus sp. AD45]PSR38212.1 DUF2520 domain-containing protein [Rhodococcus sp. AD45-ID]PVX67958.1 putative short-subunit dehydrogenase-like oxidoreductase (DUF2520 family) [Rhodococcus globerulus]